LDTKEHSFIKAVEAAWRLQLGTGGDETALCGLGGKGPLPAPKWGRTSPPEKAIWLWAPPAWHGREASVARHPGCLKRIKNQQHLTQDIDLYTTAIGGVHYIWVDLRRCFFGFLWISSTSMVGATPSIISSTQPGCRVFLLIAGCIYQTSMDP
jgi:hypothetical protein